MRHDFGDEFQASEVHLG